MSPLANPAIPKGSTVLVTGVNGLIGSHVADKFLQSGYKVRGTVRDTKKNAWMSEFFDEKYGKGNFELVSVPDMAVEGAFDEAKKGVAAFVHVASNVSFDSNPQNVIPTVVNGALVAAKAAASEPSIKRFVLTSSTWAALMPIADTKQEIDEKVWNEEAVKEAWTEGARSPAHGAIVYGASKAESEKALWKWVEETKPEMTVNCVLPSFNFGKALSLKHQGHPSTSSSIQALWEGNIEPIRYYVPQHFVDVEDAGWLHVAAAIHPDVKSERIFGVSEPYQFNKILAWMRKNYPDHKFPEDFMQGHDLTEWKPRSRAEALLKEMGQPGFTTLEASVQKNLEGLAY
ncbi:NAD-dependent epimerase/dehydratase [Lasiodiplodia theobromae]|uniref:Aldehyde reductase 2 n=1 Tax=Lasiodiplodia theobromae TaxID=45133 RepID=A0A5N5DCH9_9PEZI|nr:Aldehyde reductase 2 [Lasiodiplodia theobromae]KAF9636360.1 NAD-dependent epimerase/dehydratase [Lasiodiplodia theobromae]